jgi:RNA 2',3'-cyclic 3'-phosphodiesterase
MPRLFVAIDLPDEVKDVLAPLAPELPEARWVPPEQLHLTLRFIGDVGPETFAAIETALSALSFRRFPLTLRGVGHFPPGKRPRVLWVGMDQCDPLMQLQQELELALLDAGIAPDERRFSPHITVARLKETHPAAVFGFETRHQDLACSTFEVDEVILYSSVLTKQGAIHNREAAVRCQDPPPAS